MFHSMHTVPAEDVKSGKCRTFMGEGTAQLRTPGLVGQPSAVRVDRIDIPARIPMRFLDNHLNGQTVASDMPLLQVESDSDGTPVILRSIMSNDGLWQKGHKVYVWGEWDGDADLSLPAPTPAPAPALEKKPVVLGHSK